MTEWLFRIASLSAFVGDLDGFTAAFDYEPLTQEDGAGGRTIRAAPAFQDLLRFDFDLIDNLVGLEAVLDGTGQVVTPPVMRGPHVNAMATILPTANPTAAAAALATLSARLAGFFASLPATAYDSGAHSWHATPGGTALIDPPPARRRRVWA